MLREQKVRDWKPEKKIKQYKKLKNQIRQENQTPAPRDTKEKNIYGRCNIQSGESSGAPTGTQTEKTEQKLKQLQKVNESVTS